MDKNLGREIVKIKNQISVKVAVITNSSLLFREDVRTDLHNADTVSLKVDAITETVFKKINRPHPTLKKDKIIEGIKTFSKEFTGKLLTESMFVRGVNDSEEEIKKIARFIKEIRPNKAYIAIPTRPPTEKWVEPITEDKILFAYEIFRTQIGEKIELLTSYEGPNFKDYSEDAVAALLSIISVHPMRLDYVNEFLLKRNVKPERIIEKLLEEKRIIRIKYGNYEFILPRNQGYRSCKS